MLPLLTGKGRAHHGEILAAGAPLADADQPGPQFDGQRYVLETARAALRARRATGKVVIETGA